jgi:hypothetical protein
VEAIINTNHFGKVIWSRYASTSELGDRYYDDFAKTDGNIFAKTNYQIANKLSLFGDLHCVMSTTKPMLQKLV